MKKVIFYSIVILFAFVFSINDAMAQYPIPSFDVMLFQYNATFDEEQPQQQANKKFRQSAPREERKMTVKVEDPQPTQQTWAEVVIISMDGTTTLGPYTVNEGTNLEVTIDDGEWRLNVLNCLAGCELSVWID